MKTAEFNCFAFITARLARCILFLLIGIPAFGGRDSSTANWNLEYVGQIAGGGYPELIWNGNYLYFQEGTALTVLDGSNPAAPVLVRRALLPNMTQLVHFGDRLYLARNTEGMSLMDVTNPASPTFAGAFHNGSGVLGISWTAGYAYINNNLGELLAVDVTNPSSPTLRGVLQLPGEVVGDTVAGGNLLCISPSGTRDFRIVLVDISNPSSPTVVGNYRRKYDETYNDTLIARKISGNLLFADSIFSGIHIVDVSLPSSPTLLSNYESHDCRFLCLDGNRMITAGEKRLELVDVSNPASPSLIRSWEMGECVFSAVVRNGVGWIMTESGIWSIDLGRTGAGLFRGFYPVRGVGYFMQVRGNLAYLSGYDGLTVVDVSNPTLPTLRGYSETKDMEVYDIRLLGDKVLAIGNAPSTAALVVFDVSNSQSPRLLPKSIVLDYFPADVHGTHLAVSGEYAYMSWVREYTDSTSAGLLIADVRNPELPLEKGRMALPRPLIDLEVFGHWLLAGSNNGNTGEVTLYDLSQPATPTVQRKIEFNSPIRDFCMANDRLYSATDSALSIHDISSPDKPVLLGSYPRKAGRVSVSMGLAYVVVHGDEQSHYHQGYVCDVSDPTSPTLRAEYLFPFKTDQLFAKRDLLYMIGRGLQIFRYTGPKPFPASASAVWRRYF